MAEPGTYARGDRVILTPDRGPCCYVCGWDEGEGFVVEGQWDDEEKRYLLEVICRVCYNTDAGNATRWGLRRTQKPATEYDMHRALSQHTNLILKEIRGRSE